MIHFCVCGAFSGELGPERKLHVTLFGACELKRPTLAKQIIDMRRRADGHAPPPGKHLFVTLCGVTELKLPTLAEEYLDFQDAIRSGVLTLAEWDAAASQIGRDEAGRIASLTLCGAFSAGELPGENEEVDGLALNRHLGHIPEQAGTTLELAVGQSGPQRASLIRRAIASALASPA